MSDKYRYRLWNTTKDECEMVNDNLAQLVVELGNGNLPMASTNVYQIFERQPDGVYKVIMTIVGAS